MKTIYHVCCGLDVHKDSIVACILKTSPSSEASDKKEQILKEIRTFDTFSSSLQELRDWLVVNDCHYVAMESTGVYWFSVYETLERSCDGDFELLVVNARHMKNVPGKKTDVKDAEWIADLLRCGLLRGSFIPSEDIRELRELTRYRKNVVQDISKQKNRIEKTLQISGFKLSSFLSDIFGVTGLSLISVLVKKGYLTEEDIEELAQKISVEKRTEMKKYLTNPLSKHHQKVLEIQLKYFYEQLSHLDLVVNSITEIKAKFETEIANLDTIPGISKTAATAIVAEIGTDMSKFPTAEHLCSWAGLSPGNNESAGKKKRQELLTATRT